MDAQDKLKYDEDNDDELYVLVNVTEEIIVGTNLDDVENIVIGKGKEIQQVLFLARSNQGKLCVIYSPYSYEYDNIALEDINGYFIVNKANDLDVIKEVKKWS